MPTLTLEIAQELLDAVESEFDSIDANEFDVIDDAAAKALTKHRGEGLSLNGLTQLSDAVALALAEHESELSLNSLSEIGDSPGHVALAEKLALQDNSEELCLDCLTELSDAAAEALAEFEGNNNGDSHLCLNGLTQLSDAAAKALAHFKGDVLWLDGLDLMKLTDSLGHMSLCARLGLKTESLKKHLPDCYASIEISEIKELSDSPADITLILFHLQGDELRLDQLTELGDVASLALMGKVDLSFESLELLSATAARSLAKTEILYLDGLAYLNAGVARELAMQESRISERSVLSLDGLTHLSIADAEALAEHRGHRLSLDGLTRLSDAAAKALAKHRGHGLSLNGLTQLSDAAAKALAKHRGELYLNGLTQLSDAAAKALAKHQGYLSLNGLRQFSEAAAEMLSKHRSRVLRHREDGPAFTDAHGDREWWFDGSEYDTADQWAEAVLKSRNEPHDAKCVRQFLRHVLCKEDLI